MRHWSRSIGSCPFPLITRSASSSWNRAGIPCAISRAIESSSKNSASSLTVTIRLRFGVGKRFPNLVALHHLLHQRRPTPHEIDDTIAKADAALACTLCQFDWDWTGAESHFKRAIELDPSQGDDGLHGYALYLSSAGRHIEAIRTIKRAEELDPLVLP